MRIVAALVLSGAFGAAALKTPRNELSAVEAHRQGYQNLVRALA